MPPEEIEALRDFYHATDGVNWDCHIEGGNPWIFSEYANPCEGNWTGIGCSYGPPQRHYHVDILHLHDCSLRGTIPASIGLLTNMSRFAVFSEPQLTGTIPDVFSGMTKLQYLVLSFTGLHGEIPPSLALLSDIEYVYLGSNRLSGHAHDAFNPIVQTRLRDVDLSFNAFSGSLPSSLLLNPALELLYLSYNYFSGTLSLSLAQLPNIEAIYLSYNKLSGPIGHAFDPEVQTQLRTLDLFNNAFTGQLPDSLFQNQLVEWIDLSDNCFSGTLPHAICSGVQLQWLDLNCLACASSCTTRFLKEGAFLLHHPVSGTIPPCIFELPKLYMLSLHDNYLTGTLPANLTIRSQDIKEVGLANNALVGSVPFTMVSSVRHAAIFALSYNRLTGTINQSVVLRERYDLRLSYNRISGPAFGGNWPVNINQYLDVLTGNILGCNNGDRGRLPIRDVAYERYVCGSDGLNQPILAWIGVAGGLAALGCCAWYWREKLVAYLDVVQLTDKLVMWRSVVAGKHVGVNLPSLVLIRDVVMLLSKVAMVVAVAAVCVLAPIYAGLTVTYGTYTHQYAWILSAMLLSGKAPFAVCFVTFLLSLGLGVGALFRGHDGIAVPGSSSQPVTTHETSRRRVVQASTLYLLANFVVVGVVNAGYIAISLYTSPAYQLGISVFKVGWNLFVAPALSRWLAYELSAARADWFTLELFVSIMNNIGIPLLFTVMISPQCLNSLLVVDIPRVITIGKGLPFFYSYQCSYAYMDLYSPAFVYASLVASFGTPLLEQVLLYLRPRVPMDSALFWCIDCTLPRILKPVETDPDRIPDRSVLRPYFDTTQFLVAQLTSLTLILTMGVVLPPLALPVAVTMVVSGYIETLKVGRLLTNASEQAQHKYADIIEQECANVATPTTMRRAFWMLLWFGCWFYTLFLFDTLGDAVGFYAAYWVLIVVPLLPLVALIVYYVYLYREGACAVAVYVARRMSDVAENVAKGVVAYTPDLKYLKVNTRVTPAETPVAEVEMEEKPAGP
jgi:hypothetical protein